MSKPHVWKGSPAEAEGYVARQDEYSLVNSRRGMPAHLIEDICYQDEWIVCTCGSVIKAAEDPILHDRHEPLVAAWEAHKRDARARAAA